MFQFLLFCFATVGLTAILVDGVIFAPARNWIAKEAQARRNMPGRFPKNKSNRSGGSVFGFLESILTCYQCCGFWSGLFCGFYLITSFSEIGIVNRSWAVAHTLFMWLCTGLAGSLLAHVYLMFVELIFSTTMLVRKFAPHDHDHHDEE